MKVPTFDHSAVYIPPYCWNLFQRLEMCKDLKNYVSECFIQKEIRDRREGRRLTFRTWQIYVEHVVSSGLWFSYVNEENIIVNVPSIINTQNIGAFLIKFVKY